LRKAFTETMEDPEFVADMHKRNLGVEPLTGEEVQKIVAAAVATPGSWWSRPRIMPGNNTKGDMSMRVRLLAAGAVLLCVGSLTSARSEEKITLRYGEIANSARGISTVGSTSLSARILRTRRIDFKVVGLRGTSFQVRRWTRAMSSSSTRRCPT